MTDRWRIPRAVFLGSVGFVFGYAEYNLAIAIAFALLGATVAYWVTPR